MDVDAHGGASSVVGQLAQTEDYPLKGIPVIFEAVDLTAAVTVKYDRSQLKKVSSSSNHANATHASASNAFFDSHMPSLALSASSMTARSTESMSSPSP